MYPKENLTAFDVKDFLKTLTEHPGVYQMYGNQRELLYIGKAANLKKRVSSYFRQTGVRGKTAALVSKIFEIEVTITNSETEALLLEQNLIKRHRPPYNILLRDDKSYPKIFISNQDNYPAIQFTRKRYNSKGRLFGPFPSTNAVRESLQLIQKIFRIRQCDDSFFKHRSRPCLQYQIKRCTAPCVGLISTEDYMQDIEHAVLFLEGKSNRLMQNVASQMEMASQQLEFEKAASYRDQLISLQKIQQQQYISGDKGNADVIGIAVQSGGICICILFIRNGRVVGSKIQYPKVSLDLSESELISTLLAQWYLGGQREIPACIITACELPDKDCLQQALLHKCGKKVQILQRVRGKRAAWLKLAQTNAIQQLGSYLAGRKSLHERYLELQSVFGLDNIPQRMECFDISHSSGEATVASCVVFDSQGPSKSDYRRFNIENITQGDDYAAMQQALHRRYARLKRTEASLPDILFIDGGKGQVTQAINVLDELEIDSIMIIGIAKGSTRKAGFESLILGHSNEEITLKSDSPALHLIQHIRDEAHRFAITGHRAKRAKARNRSQLEDIAGIGARRRRALLRHFGGINEVRRASIEEITKVSNISKKLAEEIYSIFHPDT